MPPTRRKVLQTLAGGSPVVIAGCSVGTTPTDGPSDTATTEPRESNGPTPTSAPEPPTADTFSLDVSILQGFDTDHPARLEIAFTNTGERPLVGVDGPRYVLPFVDDDYAGETADGTLALFLVPDEGGPLVTPQGSDGDPVDEHLPETPTDDCWTLPLDWPADRGPVTPILNSVRLAPGETVGHGYTLYYIDECRTGTFSFENRFDLRYGRTTTPPGPAYSATVSFDLTVTNDVISVHVHEPAISTPPPEY